MTSDKNVEHFVTLFDSHYLPQGLSLYKSLEAYGKPFRLWIVALDEACARALERIAPEFVSIVRLSEIETDRLIKAKRDRSVAEYCWTLTPFLPSAVFDRQPGLDRVTYVDADLYFFDSPAKLLDEFTLSGKQVMITDHAFAPEHIANRQYGRYCVQFMTFRNTEAGLRVLHWWQDRCAEWCYFRLEDGKFGDQKYLDSWPEIFGNEVHVLSQTHRTVAPWNVRHIGLQNGKVEPVFYHFHSLRIVSPTRVVLYYNTYDIGRPNRWIYDTYVAALREATSTMREFAVPVIGRPMPNEQWWGLRYLKRWVSGRLAWAQI
jgi:hypothetical protein